MQGFMKGVGLSVNWWRLLGILLVIGSATVFIGIVYGVVYLYNHLVWV